MDTNLLRALVDLRDRTLQKSRIGFGNRISAIARGADSADAKTQERLVVWSEKFDELEALASNDIAELVDGVPIVEALCKLRGVGKILAAKLVSMIDIGRADTVSALWRYCGYAVIDGERERPTKGEKLHYNARLKTTCYLVASSFLRAGSPYRQVYDSAKEKYQAGRPDWTKAHIHNAAMRKMIKVFLSHLWLQWRTLESLPVRDLYVEEHLGHEHISTPEDFGWPKV